MKTYPVENKNINKIRAVKSGEFRPPKKGEYYLSGAPPMAYQSPNDLSHPYHIAKLVKAKLTWDYFDGS